jgi:hypothetical protein
MVLSRLVEKLRARHGSANSRCSASRRQFLRGSQSRHLQFEPLEARAMLAMLNVSPANMNGWDFNAMGAPLTASGSFVAGPATPPLGPSSAEFSTGANGNGAIRVRNVNFAGTDLADITTLTYSSYTQVASYSGLHPYIQLYLDYDGDLSTFEDLLFFEPEYQNGYTGAVPTQADATTGVWQSWDALAGGWWSVFDTLGTIAAGASVRPLADFIALNPTAQIMNPSGTGGVRFTAGFGAPTWDNYVGNIDAFTIGVSGNDTTFDFGFQPTTTYADDSWTGFAPGTMIADADSSQLGAQPAQIGYDAFATVMEAINAVAAGGRTFVNAGTYNENLMLSKTLDLEGAQVGIEARGRVVGAPNPAVEAIIAPTTGAGRPLEMQLGSGGSSIDGFAMTGSISGANGAIQSTTGATDNIQLLNNHVAIASGFTASALFLNRNAIDSTIDQNEFVAATGSAQAVFFDGPDNFDGLHFTNNNVLRSGPLGGTGLFVDGNRNIGISLSLRAPLVSGNLFQNHALGMNAGQRSFENTEFVENTFTLNTGGFAGGPLNSTIGRNTFSSNSLYGLRLTSFGNTVDPTRGAQNTLVTNNFFTGNGTTVDLVNGYGDIRIDDQFNGTQSTNTITNNSLGSTVNAFNRESNAEIINFSGNWWGTAANPEFAGKILGPAAANVDYTPWLELGTDTSGTAGFQGDFSVANVDDDSPQAGAVGRINEAVAAITNGGAIKIHAGTYAENVDAATPVKDANLSPGASPAQITINGNLTLNAGDTLTIELNGTNPLTQYDNFIVNGVVTLGGATLAATASPAPAPGSVYTIIDNDLADAVVGTFAGLPNGAALTISGTPFRLFYTAGTNSNDVQLVAGPPTITYAEDVDWDLLPLGTVLTDADQTQPGNQPGIIGYDAFNTTTAVQDAIDAVTAGGTTVVNPGTYPENVTITKALTLRGNQFGQDADARFAAFVPGVDGPKADPTVESIITAPVNNPTGGNPGANDLIRALASEIAINGLVIDGNNPALGASATQINGVDIDARRGITNVDSANAVVDISNFSLESSILQNFGQRAMSISGNGPLQSGNSISENVIRSFLEQGVLIFGNFYVDITDNTIDVPNDAIGVHLQNFHSTPSTMTWSGNTVTVGQDAFGMHVNLLYASGAVLNIANNTINAASGVTGASDFTWGLNLWSVQNGATVNATNNTIGSGGGEFARGINLWNLPTLTTVTVSGGSVGSSLVGINLDNVDPFFGAGADTTVNVQNVAVSANSVGLRVRSDVVNAVSPAGDVQVNLTGGSFSSIPTGIQVLDAVADTFTASLQVAGSPSVTSGTTGLEIDGAETALIGNTLASMSFSGQSGQHIAFGAVTLDNLEIDATGVSFNGSTGAGKTTAQNYANEDKITHGVDDSGRGFVRVRAGNVFTTPNSFIIGPADVQDAIDVAANGNTLHVQGGSYTGSANVSPVDLTISLGASPAQVVINGNLSLDGGDTLVMELNGASDVTDYDNFVVNGTVSLGNGIDGFATLSATAGFVYPALSFVKLIQNNLADLTTGHFNGLLDGNTIVISGQTFLIFHNGGDGNDVILVKALTPITPATVYAEDADWTDFTLGTLVDGDLSTGAFETAFIGYNAFNNRPTTAPTTLTPLQDAVDAVAVNGTVIVNDGAYPENVFVQKSLTLDGQPTGGSANIAGSGAGIRLVINSPATNVTVKDMTISGGGPALHADMGAAAQLLLWNINTAGAASGGMIDVVGTVTFRTNDGVDQVSVDGNSFEEATDVLPITYSTINTLNIQTLDGNDTINAISAGLGGPVINIDGGLPPASPSPTPTGDIAGDTLNLDMTAATGPVIVSTVPGFATSASTKQLNFVQIEDLNLTDGVLTNAVMGDLYIRGTGNNDIIQFTMTRPLSPGVSPATIRTRVNSQFHNLNVSNKLVAYGRGGNDTIQMTNVTLAGEIYGEANDDYISGYHGSDLLVGGDGNDRLLGGEGVNTLWGDNVGEQSLAAGGNDILSSGSGADTAYGGGGIDTINVGAGDDYVFGGFGNDTIDGMDGHDRLYGGEGDDTITGYTGNDLLAGNGGNDKLYGKSGNDVLIGGDGADLLAGEDGNDLMFHNAADVTSPTAGNDNSTTKNDANDQAMLALLNDWSDNGVFNLITLGADIDDGDIDTLGGGTGTDGARKGPGDIGDWEFLF